MKGKWGRRGRVREGWGWGMERRKGEEGGERMMKRKERKEQEDGRKRMRRKGSEGEELGRDKDEGGEVRKKEDEINRITVSKKQEREEKEKEIEEAKANNSVKEGEARKGK